MTELKEQPNCEGCEFFKHTHSNEHCYRYTEEPSLCKLRQEPVEQSPAGDFTKRLRANANDEGNWTGLFGKMLKGDIFEACTIIDRSEASRKKLLAALEPFAKCADLIPSRYAPEPQWAKFNTKIQHLSLDKYREAKAAIKANKQGD